MKRAPFTALVLGLTKVAIESTSNLIAVVVVLITVALIAARLFAVLDNAFAERSCRERKDIIKPIETLVPHRQR